MGGHAGNRKVRRVLVGRSANLRGCSPFLRGEQKKHTMGAGRVKTCQPMSMFFQASMGIPDGKAGKATTKNSPENFSVPVKLWKRQ